MYYSTRKANSQKTQNTATAGVFIGIAFIIGFLFTGATSNGLAMLVSSSSAYASSVPTITLIGNTTMTLDEGDTYTEPGYVANDTEDGDLTGSITVNSGGLDTNTPGTYTLTYSVVDADSNTISSTRTVIINSTNTAPAVTLLGSTTMTLSAGDTYTEPGYTANDTQDGDLTGAVAVVDGGLDTNTPGTYTLTYSVVDAGGLSDARTREISVLAAATPNTAPTITLVGANPVNLTQGDTYTEPGYTANDAEDGDLTGAVSVNTGGLDTNTPGTYTLTYSVTDTTGDTATITRSVVIASAGGGGGGSSNTPPTITLIGANPVTLTAGSTYTEPGYTANDAEDGDKTSVVTVNNGGLDTNTPGTYTLTYTVVDNNGAVASATRTVIVNAGGPVNTPPTITLIGANSVTVIEGNTYIEPGYTAADTEDGDLTSAVTVNNGGLNTSALGTYTLTYTVADSGLLTANTTRTVEVVAAPITGCTSNCGGGGGGSTNHAPTLRLKGDLIVTVPQGTDYIEPGYIADDIEDGDITSEVRITKDGLDTDVLGTYTLQYNVRDRHGLYAPEVRRIVEVVPATDTPVDPVDPEGPVKPEACTYLVGFSRYQNTAVGENDPVEVAKVQRFLNEFEGTNLPVDGVFSLDLDAHVKAFQEKYRGDILNPWTHELPTGYVYLTTRKKINEIYCEREFPLTVDQQVEIAAFRSEIASARTNVRSNNPSNIPNTGTSNPGNANGITDLIEGDVIERGDGTRTEDSGSVPADANERVGFEIDTPENDGLAATGLRGDRNTFEKAAVNVFESLRGGVRRFGNIFK